MPRGVYPRKKKGEAAVAEAPAEVKQKRKYTKKAAPLANAPIAAADMEKSVAPTAVKFLDTTYGFQTLGVNLSTLTDAYTRLRDTDPQISSKIGEELLGTLATMRSLRIETFGGLSGEAINTKIAAVEEGLKKEVAAPVQAPAPVTAPPPAVAAPPPPATTLPQGNAGYTPPAPPLPHH